MSAVFVLDASAAIAWALPDESPPVSIGAAIASGLALVPALWVFEVQNVLAMLKRRRRLTGADWTAAAAAVRAIVVETESVVRERVELEISHLAETQGLTVYDAAYLELAKRRRLPLATLDDDLRKAARRAKVRLI